MLIKSKELKIFADYTRNTYLSIAINLDAESEIFVHKVSNKYGWSSKNFAHHVVSYSRSVKYLMKNFKKFTQWANFYHRDAPLFGILVERRLHRIKDLDEIFNNIII